MSEFDSVGIEVIKGTVEYVLRNHVGNHYLGSSPFSRKLSTYPEHVDPFVNEHSLRNKCEVLSRELFLYLPPNLAVDLSMSANTESSPKHFYLVSYSLEEEILIDPTLGQFLKGHNYVFIGTRMKLKQLILAGVPGVTILGQTVWDYPKDLEEFFEEMCGSSSKTYAEFISESQRRK